MASSFEITGDFAKLDAIMREVSEEVGAKAAAKAVNQAAGKIVKEARKIARDKTGVPAKILKRRISIRGRMKATKQRPRIVIFGGQWPVLVTDLSPKPRRLKSGAVKYKTLPGQSQDPGAFMGRRRGRSGTGGSGEGVYTREEGAKRLPINNVSVDISEAVKRAIVSYARSGTAARQYDEYFDKAFSREMRNACRRKGVPVV